MQQPDNRFKNIERITKFMDSQFSIGKYRFGIDPLLNLIPFLGDGVTFLISGWLIMVMSKHGASSKVATKMTINILIDAIIGAIPILGWIFDFYFKANERNLKLLKEHYQEGKHQGSGKNMLVGILIIFMFVIIAVIYGMWKLTEWVFSSF